MATVAAVLEHALPDAARPDEPFRDGSLYFRPTPLSLASVSTREALIAAWEHVRPRTKCAGADGITVEQFAVRVDAHIHTLASELARGQYAPHPVRRVRIPKEAHPGEHRTIGIASLRDRIVQQALRVALEPIAERTFLDCSYGYRPGKGPARAIARVTHHLTSLRHRWAARGDVDDCFGSLRHDLLLDRVRSLGADDGLVRLVELFARMGEIDGFGRWHDVDDGISQGSILSPLLANLYLHPFDEAMRGRGYSLVRYADDFIITGPDESTAQAGLSFATATLQDSLGLKLNLEADPIASVERGFTFLGILFRGSTRLPSPEKVARIEQKVRAAVREAGADLDTGLEHVMEMAAGWRRYYGQVLEASACAAIDEILARGVARLAASAHRAGRWRTRGELGAALSVLVSVGGLVPGARERWLRQIVDRAVWLTHAFTEEKGRGAMEPHTAAITGRSVNNETRAGDSVSSPGGHPPASPAVVVRRRKREYTRKGPESIRLVINSPGSFLGKTGQRFVVRQDRQVVTDLPALKVGGITLASHGVALSTDALALAVESGIQLILLKSTGQPYAAVAPVDGGDGRVPLFQVEAVRDGAAAVLLGKAFVRGKITNQLHLARHLGKYLKRRDGAYAEVLERYVDAFPTLMDELDAVKFDGSLVVARERVMGIEGRAAVHYWAAFRQALGERSGFPGRQHREATDPVNNLLNYGYGVLRARVHLAVIAAGLLPSVGLLHATEPGRPSLVLDLMEEFRAPVVDRAVMTVVHRREPVELDAEGRLSADTRARLICRLQRILAVPVKWRGGEPSLGDIIENQARLLASHLAGGRTYRPFVSRW